ncbi:transposase [Allobaculum mucilyticum]|nr:transposase [Allobaculum mucilyticum]
MIHTVCTNLSEAEFGTEDIKQIYRLRWQVEVGFRGLKRNTDLEWTHSRKLDLVQAEIYAKMTLYNLCSRLRNKVERSRQHQKRIAQAKSTSRRQISDSSSKRFNSGCSKKPESA